MELSLCFVHLFHLFHSLGWYYTSFSCAVISECTCASEINEVKVFLSNQTGGQAGIPIDVLSGCQPFNLVLDLRDFRRCRISGTLYNGSRRGFLCWLKLRRNGAINWRSLLIRQIRLEPSEPARDGRTRWEPDAKEDSVTVTRPSPIRSPIELILPSPALNQPVCYLRRYVFHSEEEEPFEEKFQSRKGYHAETN